jgi:hypothetical protein
MAFFAIVRVGPLTETFFGFGTTPVCSLLLAATPPKLGGELRLNVI